MSKLPRNEQNVVDFTVKLKANWRKMFDSDESETAWNDMMIDELKVFDEEVLIEAAKILLRKKLRGFPLLAECIDACAEARKAIEWRKPKIPIGSEGKPPDTAGRYEALADDLIMGPDGREAARAGYISSFHQYIVKHGRSPDRHAIKQVVQEARDLDETYAGLISGRQKCVPEHRNLLIDLGTKMLARREELRTRVLGSEA